MTTLAQVFIFHLIFFIPVGNQDLHKSMDEFEFRSDPITDYGVSCPWVSENYTFTRFPMQFLFRSFYPPTKSEGYSFGVVRPSVCPFRPSFRPSVCPHFLSVRNHISVPIGQIWFILGTNDKYHGLSISYKLGQNRPLNTWVIALVLV